MSEFYDGCFICGEHQVLTGPIDGRDYALCSDCWADETLECPTCETNHWQKDMTRVGRELLCSTCANYHPAVVGSVVAALNADERKR